MHVKEISLLFSVVITLAVVKGKRKFRCDYQYVHEAEAFFKYHENPAVWHEAELTCFLEGAILASPLNNDIKEAMFHLAYRKSDIVFTGIHSSYNNGDLVSVEGVPLRKINHKWAKEEPNNLLGQKNCVAQRYYDGTITLVECNKTLPFMCYKPFKDKEYVSECGTTDTEYKADYRTGSCYKFHKVGRPWSRAYMTCESEGAHLAIINSDLEAVVIQEIFQKYPEASLIYQPFRDVALLGYQDWRNMGTFQTIFGQIPAEAGYDKFSKDNPDNITGNCMSVYRTGLLHSYPCEERAAFICEKVPSYDDPCM